MTSLLRRQPLKGAYILLCLTYYGGFKAPLWALKYLLLPSSRPCRNYTLVESVFVTLLTRLTYLLPNAGLDMGADPTIEKKRRCFSESTWVRVAPAPKEIIKGELQRLCTLGRGAVPVPISGYWYGKREHRGDGKSPVRARKGEKIVYYIHSGAYISLAAHEKSFTSAVPKSILKAAARSTPVRRIFSIEYRLATRAPFPSPILDALSGWHYLVNECGFEPEDIVVMGDSAGGNCALALTRYLRDTNLTSLPAGLLLFSPWTDLSGSHSGPGFSGDRNIPSDYLPPFVVNYSVATITKGLPEDAIRHEYFSSCSLTLPATKELFHGFPRSFIGASDRERLVDEIRTLYTRLALSAPTVDPRTQTQLPPIDPATPSASAGAWVQYVESQNSPHDILVLPPFVFRRQQKELVTLAVLWLREVLGSGEEGRAKN